jgi:membrane protein implicated in regulation of membrane protease activity
MLLLYVYIGSLVVGGILLGTSLLLGHDSDADAHIDVDADADVDVDADMDADADADAHIDVDHGGLAEVWLPFMSLRFWVFFLAFFGATGTVLSLFALAGKWTTLAAALVMGLGIGFCAAYIIQRLKRDVVGEVADEQDYKGQEGTVQLPISVQAPGKVRLTVQGQTVDLPARTDEQAELPVGAKVLVIDCADNTLTVVRAPDLGTN